MFRMCCSCQVPWWVTASLMIAWQAIIRIAVWHLNAYIATRIGVGSCFELFFTSLIHLHFNSYPYLLDVMGHVGQNPASLLYGTSVSNIILQNYLCHHQSHVASLHFATFFLSKVSFLWAWLLLLVLTVAIQYPQQGRIQGAPVIKLKKIA